MGIAEIEKYAHPQIFCDKYAACPGLHMSILCHSHGWSSKLFEKQRLTYSKSVLIIAWFSRFKKRRPHFLET